MAERSPEDERPDRLMALPIFRVIEEYPEVLPVLYNHLGASCFDCPGRFDETLEKGVHLHEADSKEFREDLRFALSNESEKEN